MKKKLLIISIISTALAVAGFVLAEIAFKPAKLFGVGFLGMFSFKMIFDQKDWIWLLTSLISIAGLIVVIVFWVLHLIKLIKTKAKQWIAVDVLGFVGGLFGVFLFAGLMNKHALIDFEMVNSHPGYWANSLIDGLIEIHTDWVNPWGNVFSPLFEEHKYFGAIIGILGVPAGIAAFVLSLKALVLSRKVMEGKVKENAEEEAEEPSEVSAKEGEGAPTSEDELRGAENAELEDEEANGKKVGPYVIQYFNYGPAPKAEEEKKPAAEEEEEEEDMLTSDDLRKIIREEMRIDPNAPKATPLTADEVREIVKEEIEKALKAQTPAPSNTAMEQQQNAAIKQLQDNQLTSEQVRTVVSQELDKRSPASQPAPVEKKEAPQPEPKLEPAPAPVVVQVVAAPAPTPAPAPAPAPAPVEEPKKIVRVPFPERLDQADKDVKANYNEIKAEALSFGLKSRLSNSGDTFRLHTKTYLKITVAGKGLKLYYALDPKAYENSPIPLKDASSKNIYKEIPGCFKVKSELSVKRAKQLIADACEKDNLEQGKAEIKNYAAEMKDYKPQNGDDDGGDDGDDDDK